MERGVTTSKMDARSLILFILGDPPARSFGAILGVTGALADCKSPYGREGVCCASVCFILRKRTVLSLSVGDLHISSNYELN